MQSMLDQWLKVLGGDEYDLTADEIADMCRLVLIQHRFGVEKPQEVRAEPSLTPPKPTGDVDGSTTASSDLPDLPPVDVSRDTPPSQGGLFARDTSSTPRTDSRNLRIPTAPALRYPLPLARALRLLMQQLPIGQGSQLDESATVQKIAEEKVWWPVTKPLTENWLELALVVDESASMLIWRRTVEDLARFFRHYGFFRDVRLWGLIAKQSANSSPAHSDREASATSLSPAQASIYLRATPFARFRTQELRQPDSLVDPSGRRLILIVSDCVDDLWQTPQLLSTLRSWASSNPIALLQMMPEWLWPRTKLRQATVVNFRGKTKGSANQALDVVLASATYYRKSRAEKQTDIKIPVLTLEPDRMYVWAQMLTAHGSHQAPGVIFNSRAQRMTVAAQQRRQQQAVTAVATATFKAQTFRGGASPLARRLASLLAASPVITFPIIRVVQDRLLPRSEQVHVAEVLLGGILRPRQAPALDANPDHVQYEFIDPDVRSKLLAEAPVKDITAVLSHYIEENFNTSLYDFIVELRRLMRSETTSAEALKPIAIIAAEVLRYRGAEYADFVREVQVCYEPSGLAEEDYDPSYPLPALEDFEFIDAQFEDVSERSFPPALRLDDFTVITVELPPSMDSPTGLEQFEFIVATFTRRGTEWEIKRQHQAAYKFVERLPVASNQSLFENIAKRLGLQRNTNFLSLEMVAIPGGTSLMGSAEGELERNDERESPQHEVTVQPFFMGRYPVTQAQWRVVATMPQVEQGLEADPSRFKGDRRPVEQVSWNDAVEFCARLSAHTGRDYRLPTEAEWEYACRVGTMTPFHFGDMITTEVANYNGRAYSGGPEGERRGKTTLVDHFGIANAYGLSDMHGNVFEWCQDYWHENYDGAPTNGIAWIEGGDSSRRVYRGGSWSINPWFCRSAYRDRGTPGFDYFLIGFRVVCSAPRALP